MPEPARPNTPAPSMQSFVTPTATVKSGPSIKDLIHDPVPPAPAASENNVPPQEPARASENTPAEDVPASAPAEPAQQPVQEEVVSEESVPQSVTEELVQEELVPQPATDAADTQSLPQETESAQAPEEVEPVSEEDDLLPRDVVEDAPVVKRPDPDPDADPENFQLFWEAMVDAVFADVPTLHEPLKHYHPVRKENILIVPVKNDIQENDFAPRKHQVLRYLRENWDEKLDDIEVKLDINMEIKKFILDDNDKLNALREQNPDIADFIKFLNLRIKH